LGHGDTTCVAALQAEASFPPLLHPQHPAAAGRRRPALPAAAAAAAGRAAVQGRRLLHACRTGQDTQEQQGPAQHNSLRQRHRTAGHTPIPCRRCLKHLRLPSCGDLTPLLQQLGNCSTNPVLLLQTYSTVEAIAAQPLVLLPALKRKGPRSAPSTTQISAYLTSPAAARPYAGPPPAPPQPPLSCRPAAAAAVGLDAPPAP
jgi:hypothetical protein